MTEFVSDLAQFRLAHKSVRQTRFLHGAKRARDGAQDVEWTDFDGNALEWSDPDLASFCLTLRCSAEAPEYEPDSDVVFIAFNRGAMALPITLPMLPETHHWLRGIDTDTTSQAMFCELETDGALVAAQSVVAFVVKPNGATT